MTPAGADSQADIAEFIDALWLEDGLSSNTLSAYRQDLALFAAWLALSKRTLLATTEVDLQAYISEKHASTKATTANRRLTVFKRYFRWALREGRVLADPTLRLEPAKTCPARSQEHDRGAGGGAAGGAGHLAGPGCA